MSCLQALEGEDTENPFICHIMNLFWALSDKGACFHFCWVPSHCGIDGNERVDQLAKENLNQDIDPLASVHYSVSLIYRGCVYRGCVYSGIRYMVVAGWTPFFCSLISRIYQLWLRLRYCPSVTMALDRGRETTGVPSTLVLKWHLSLFNTSKRLSRLSTWHLISANNDQNIR